MHAIVKHGDTWAITRNGSISVFEFRYDNNIIVVKYHVIDIDIVYM